MYRHCLESGVLPSPAVLDDREPRFLRIIEYRSDWRRSPIRIVLCNIYLIVVLSPITDCDFRNSPLFGLCDIPLAVRCGVVLVWVVVPLKDSVANIEYWKYFILCVSAFV